jgi:hypothetical protein
LLEPASSCRSFPQRRPGAPAADHLMRENSRGRRRFRSNVPWPLTYPGLSWGETKPLSQKAACFRFHFRRLHPIGVARVNLSSEGQWFPTYTLQPGVKGQAGDAPHKDAFHAISTAVVSSNLRLDWTCRHNKDCSSPSRCGSRCISYRAVQSSGSGQAGVRQTTRDPAVAGFSKQPPAAVGSV